MQKVKLENYVEQIRGVSYKPTDLFEKLEVGSVILLRANNIFDSKVNFEDVVYVDKNKVKNNQFLRAGDILICTSSGSKDLVGKAAYIENDLNVTFGAFCKVIRPKGIESAFLGHFFQSQIYRHSISESCIGVNINNIRGEHIDNLEIPLPSFSEQKAIAEKLDKVSSLIEKRKQQLSLLDTLVKSKFVEMFGGIHDSYKYSYRAVEKLADVVSGGTPSRDYVDYWKEGTIPWVKTTELQNNLITKTEEFITERGLTNSSAKIVPANTVLIAMYGQGKTRGMTGLLGIEACTNQACACILPSAKINHKYLWYYFILSYENLRNMAKGGNQPNLNSNIIKKYLVLYPPMELQNKFADFAEKAEKLKVKIKQSLAALELLKKSLMQKYFG